MNIDIPKQEYSLENLPSNIRNRIQEINHHWIWTGGITDSNRPDPKGRVRFNGKLEYPHRIVFHLLTGFDLNSRLQVNHKRECEFSLCCFPGCLYAGTQQENMEDRDELGHNRYAEYTHCNTCGSELRTSPTTGHRYCQTCKNNRRNEWRKKKRELK